MHLARVLHRTDCIRRLDRIGATNASAIVAGPGGRKQILGTNLIAITIPGKDGPLMHADFSTSAVALGKITMAKEAGERSLLVGQ